MYLYFKTFLTGEERGTHSLPTLKYDYAALEPHISSLIMEIHHTKHHQAYINNLIAATKKARSLSVCKSTLSTGPWHPARLQFLSTLFAVFLTLFYIYFPRSSTLLGASKDLDVWRRLFLH